MKYLLLSFSLLSIGASFAQNDGHIRCGSDNHYQEHLQNHPEVVQQRAELQDFTEMFAQTYNPQQKKATLTIPVVFHVNDPSNPQKVTLAQVQSALDILNEDYSATNADISNIRPEFTSIVANMDIQFCLASKDPQGQSTSGITYHYNSYNGREPDTYGSYVKSVEHWPPNKYLNIWIVNYVEADGSLYNSGWAFLPDDWIANNNLDGIVFNHRYLGYEGSSEVSGPSSWQAEMARVLTHEVGHYLNLHHTFENYCASPGDYVDDTPYVYYHGSNNCDQLGTFCPSTSVVQDQNYMDYTPCPSMFTLGQKTRVIAALNSSVAGRNNLWTTANLIATGCMDNSSLDEIMALEGIAVYPNPASTAVSMNINLANTSNLKITLKNAVGQTINTRDINPSASQTVTLSIEELPAGVYFIELAGDNASSTKRIVKNQ